MKEQKKERTASVIDNKTLLIKSEIQRNSVVDESEKDVPLNERCNIICGDEIEAVKCIFLELSRILQNPLKELVLLGKLGTSYNGVDSFNISIGVEFERPITNGVCDKLKEYGIGVWMESLGDYGLNKQEN